VLEEAIPFYEESGDEAGLARALGVAGNLRFWRGEASAAIEDLTRAARHARNAGERTQEVESLQYVLVAMLMGPTPVGEALAGVEELSSAAERSRSLSVHVLRAGAHLEAMRGRFATARDLIAQAKELATELGLELTLARIAFRLGPSSCSRATLRPRSGSCARRTRPSSAWRTGATSRASSHGLSTPS
jgi:hypothetical protein